MLSQAEKERTMNTEKEPVQEKSSKAGTKPEGAAKNRCCGPSCCSTTQATRVDGIEADPITKEPS